MSKSVRLRAGMAALGPPPSMSMPSSDTQDSAADDPFSQLSLSRGPSGETPHLEYDHNCGKEPFSVCTAFCCITKHCMMCAHVFVFNLHERCLFPLIPNDLHSDVKLSQALQIIVEWMHRHYM